MSLTPLPSSPLLSACSCSLKPNHSDTSSSSQLMPATVTVLNRPNTTTAEQDDGDSSDGEGEEEEFTSGSSDDDGDGGGSSSDDTTRNTINSTERSAVVMTLGPPEVDQGTGNTVFSLSAEREVRQGGVGGFVRRLGLQFILRSIWVQ